MKGKDINSVHATASTVYVHFWCITQWLHCGTIVTSLQLLSILIARPHFHKINKKQEKKIRRAYCQRYACHLFVQMYDRSDGSNRYAHTKGEKVRISSSGGLKMEFAIVFMR